MKYKNFKVTWVYNDIGVNKTANSMKQETHLAHTEGTGCCYGFK